MTAVIVLILGYATFAPMNCEQITVRDANKPASAK